MIGETQRDGFGPAFDDPGGLHGRIERHFPGCSGRPGDFDRGRTDGFWQSKEQDPFVGGLVAITGDQLLLAARGACGHRHVGTESVSGRVGGHQGQNERLSDRNASIDHQRGRTVDVRDDKIRQPVPVPVESSQTAPGASRGKKLSYAWACREKLTFGDDSPVVMTASSRPSRSTSRN